MIVSLPAPAWTSLAEGVALMKSSPAVPTVTDGAPAVPPVGAGGGVGVGVGVVPVTGGPPPTVGGDDRVKLLMLMSARLRPWRITASSATPLSLPLSAKTTTSAPTATTTTLAVPAAISPLAVVAAVVKSAAVVST